MKNFKQKMRYGFGASFLAAASAANAALPPGVTDAVSTAQADGVELGGLLLALAVAVGVIFWLKRKA